MRWFSAIADQRHGYKAVPGEGKHKASIYLMFYVKKIVKKL